MTSTKIRPSVSYSLVMRPTCPNHIGMLARLTHVIGPHGGDLGAVDSVNPDAKRMTRDVIVRARGYALCTSKEAISPCQRRRRCQSLPNSRQSF